jgi:ubiquinone/menaquinone biosynthesis C-methylase UbiE
MCAHKFDPSKHSRLDSDERRKVLPIEKILKRIRPLKDLVVIDVGCGKGYFAFPIADGVGVNGKVYAVDTSEEMLTLLRQAIPQSSNLEPVLSTECDIPLASGIADVLFMSAVYHEFDDRPEMIKELIRLAKPGARFVVIDWNQRSDAQGPPISHRVAKEQVIDEFAAAGCQVSKQFRPSRDFYGLVFRFRGLAAAS